MKMARMAACLAVVGGMVIGAAWPGQGWGAGTTGGRAATASRPTPPASTAATALYNQIVNKYTASQWDTIGTDLAKTKDIAAMSKEQQVDIAYIKQALTDGRPPWWDQVKQGRKIQFPARLWLRTVPVTWDPALDPGLVNMQNSGGQLTFSMAWIASDMDSTKADEHGFTKGDTVCATLWSALEMTEIYSSLSLQRLGSIDQPQKIKLNRFMAFRGTLTAAYFGTPRARRWMGFLSTDAYVSSHLTNDGFIPRRPFGAMLVAEIVSNPSKYPSLRLQARNVNADNAEGTLATNLMGQFERTTLTFAEDRALREAVKTFALANDTRIFESGNIVLPSKLTIPLNPDDDKEGKDAAKRNKWLMEELAQPGVHAAAASKPATTRAKPNP
jgi:hypothetical protein